MPAFSLPLRSSVAAKGLAWVAVVFAFGTAGAFSSRFFEADHLLTMCLLPLPFALLCAAIVVRTPLAVLTIPAQMLAWFTAYYTVMFTLNSLSSSSMCLAGAVGGFAVTLPVAWTNRELMTARILGGAAAAGAIAAVPFAIGISVPALRISMSMCFAAWQSAMGTYLFAVCCPRPQAG